MLTPVVAEERHRGWHQALFKSAFDDTTPQHVKDAYTSVEFIKWLPEHGKMQLDPILMRTVTLSNLKFAPIRMATPEFYAFTQQIENTVREDLVTSFILPCMMYTSPTLMVLTPPSAYVGNQLRDTAFPYTYSSCHTMRMLKCALIYIQNMKVTAHDAAKKEAVEWDNTKQSIAIAIEKKINTNRKALFGTVREINGIWQEQQKEADEKWTKAQKDYEEKKKVMDVKLTTISKEDTDERGKVVAEAVSVRKELEQAKKEWEMAKKREPDYERFHTEHRQYTLHLIRAVELHLMMLNGAPMDSGSNFFTSAVFPTEDQVHSKTELSNCAKVRTTQAMDLNEAFQRFGVIYPRATPIKNLMDRCHEISQKAKAPFAYSGLIAQEIPPMSELEYSTGIFNIISKQQSSVGPPPKQRKQKKGKRG